MAVARTPGPSEARVPCPLCGGAIHPIAGRCKHCKGDVAEHRGARPAAAAALPPLAIGVPAVPPPGVGNGHGAPSTNGHYPAPGPAAQLAASVAVPTSYDDAQPILPPRPTGRMQAAPSRSIWRTWPVIVIVLAAIAIATAVVLMVWPPSSTAKAGAGGKPPPAPDRMDTNPLPPRDPGAGLGGGGSDPWSNGIVPRTAPVPPDDDDDDDDVDDQVAIDPSDLLQDPFANPSVGGSPNPFARGGSLSGSGIMVTMMKRACERAKSCSNAQLDAMCTMLDQFPSPPIPSGCTAARRCLAAVDKLDVCGAPASGGGMGMDMMDLTRLFTTAQDCVDAMRC